MYKRQPLEISNNQPVAPTQVLTFLAVGGTVQELAEEYSVVIGEAEAREFLASVDEEAGRSAGEYSPPTLELISTNLMLGELSQAEDSAAAIEERFVELAQDIEVNPRYGEVSGEGSLLIVPTQHPWLVTPEAPEA